tara:strand:+ start:379 stop:483 length:105 start_codon:yes stop_codon:yes gene_type:complete
MFKKDLFVILPLCPFGNLRVDLNSNLYDFKYENE